MDAKKQTPAERQVPTEAPAGRSVAEWTRAVGLSRASFYNMPNAYRPRNVRVGKRVVILEAPLDWLERMAELGGVPTRSRAEDAA